jgi:hypothetical protein
VHFVYSIIDMSIRGKIKKTIDPHAKLVTIHRTSSYTSNSPLSCFKIIAKVLRGYNLRENKEVEQECYSYWCYIVIDGERFEAKIIHKGRGKFKILADVGVANWREKIEMIGIDIKSLNREIETGRLILRTTFIDQYFINELDKIGLQLIKITAGRIFTHGLIVLLEPKSTRMLTE